MYAPEPEDESASVSTGSATLSATSWPTQAALLAAVEVRVPVAPAAPSDSPAASTVAPLPPVSKRSVMLPGGVKLVFVLLPKKPTSHPLAVVVVTVGATTAVPFVLLAAPPETSTGFVVSTPE